MNKEKIRSKANELLKEIYGPDAEFKDGQYEAIEAVLTNKRTLVVQKTGWGKSLVYFISAKMTEGLTIVISPLLVLMDNQTDFLGDEGIKLGLRYGVLNYTVKNTTDSKDRTAVINGLKNGSYDIFFTTPETLFSDDLRDIIPTLNIGLFVIDECHCISDWGHDFRTKYGRLNKIIDMLPSNVKVLGTTATANDRVIADLKKQFGNEVFVSRGPLMREKLHIEIVPLETRAQRFAWIIQNIEKLPGTGIIYCLTHRDCKRLTDFLVDNGINARSYYSETKLEKENHETERMFMKNEIKVIVATIKLGMGYDKPDIRFVIHFQQPSSLVAYYQQIGRAGRDGKGAYCYMMTGKEDREIQNYFIDKAFPTEYQEKQIIDALDGSENGLNGNELLAVCNMDAGALEKTLVMLSNWEMISYESESKKYYRTPKKYFYNKSYYEEIKAVKHKELDKMFEYAGEKGCLSKYVLTELNDKTAEECGICANCLGHGILSGIEMPKDDMVKEIAVTLSKDYLEISPRKLWPDHSKIRNQNETGVALAKYGDEGYGKMVAEDKYHADIFRDELVKKSAQLIREKFGTENTINAIVNVPSRRNNKVADFAIRVSEELKVPYLDVLVKDPNKDAPQQKTLNNSFHQCQNVRDTVSVKENAVISGNIVLIDDVVDSKWTLTVCGDMLIQNGAEKVFPFCLADSSIKKEE